MLINAPLYIEAIRATRCANRLAVHLKPLGCRYGPSDLLMSPHACRSRAGCLSIATELMTRTRAVELSLGTAFMGTLLGGAAMVGMALGGSDWANGRGSDLLIAGLSVSALAAAPLAIAASREA